MWYIEDSIFLGPQAMFWPRMLLASSGISAMLASMQERFECMTVCTVMTLCYNWRRFVTVNIELKYVSTFVSLLGKKNKISRRFTVDNLWASLNSYSGNACLKWCDTGHIKWCELVDCAGCVQQFPYSCHVVLKPILKLFPSSGKL